MASDDAGGPRSDAADPRALAAALQAALHVPSTQGACRAVLAEVRTAVPFAFGVVLRFPDEGAAEVASTYPAGMAGIEDGARWTPLDAAERALLRFGEPMLESVLRASGSDRSPLTRLPAFGLRSALRVPLFHGGRVVGAVLLFAYEAAAFSVRHGVVLEECVRALGARVGAPPHSAQATNGSSEEHSLSAPSAGSLAASLDAAPRDSDSPMGGTPSMTREEPERLSVMGELISGVAHELNNPLTTILGYAQMLPSLEGEQQRQAAAVIADEAQRAGRIVRNLLYFARQHRPRVEPVDINRVLARVVEVRRYALEADNIHLVAQFADVPELLGDQYQLEQVFLNLVTNAQQALQQDGGTITLASEATRDAVRVSVTDTGPGIPEEIAPRIFEPFFSTREVGEGSGLGLSIAYGIVHSHGGRLTAERPAAGGARFVVELPLPPVAPTPTLDPNYRGVGERVLVVEDEAAVRALVSAILENAGYQVTTAQTGAEALDVLGQQHYDLVIADAQMSVGAGEELATTITARWPQLATRLVVVSGDSQVGPAVQGVRVLAKPFTAATLLASVADALGADTTS